MKLSKILASLVVVMSFSSATSFADESHKIQILDGSRIYWGDAFFLIVEKNEDSWKAISVSRSYPNFYKIIKEKQEVLIFSQDIEKVEPYYSIYIDWFKNAADRQYSQTSPKNDSTYFCYSSDKKRRPYNPCDSSLSLPANVGASVATNVFTNVLTLGMAAMEGGVRTSVEVDKEKVQKILDSTDALNIVNAYAKKLDEENHVKAYRNSFEQAKSSYALKNFIEHYHNDDPEGLVTKAQQALPDVEATEMAQWLVEYRKIFESASTVSDYENFISKYRNNDPDRLIQKAETRYKTLFYKEARQKEVALATEKSELESKEIGETVCNSLENTVSRKVIAEGRDGPIYGGVEKGNTRLQGFVEGISPNKKKVQIRLSAIRFFSVRGGNHEEDSPFTDYNGVNIKTGDIIWDSTYKWKPCN